MTDTMIVPPNLDAMSIEDLGEVLKNATLISIYAGAKIIAIRERAAGNIDKAIEAEARAEAAYNLMPLAMRW